MTMGGVGGSQVQFIGGYAKYLAPRFISRVMTWVGHVSLYLVCLSGT
jgi:hypothetical protein